MTSSPLTGALLIAMPQLLDPNFVRSVLLIVHHDREGTFGLVLNRPLEMSAESLCQGLDMPWGGPRDQSLFLGGPVQQERCSLLFTDDFTDDHGSRPLDKDETTAISAGLFFSGSLGVLQEVAAAPPGSLRLFLGYAGWGEGQLEAEMAQGAWLTAPATREGMFDVDAELMWEHSVRSLGVEPATLTSTSGIH